MERRDSRNGGEASWGAVRGRGLVGPLTHDREPLHVVPTTAGVTAMNTPTYDKSITALLVVDPYNDFISEGGKLWPLIKAVAEANDCVSNMLKVLNAARSEASRLLCHASSISCRRLRNMDVRRAGPTRRVAAQELRIRHMGWRVPCRIRAGAR